MTSPIILQAIVTTWTAPTNTRGARIIAKAAAGKVTIAYNHAMNAEDNHFEAAAQLAVKFGWIDGWCLKSGCLPNGSYCHVLVKVAS